MNDSHGGERCTMCAFNHTANDPNILFGNDIWIVRAVPVGRGLPGWLLLQSKRHVAGINEFNDVEAADFGVIMRHLQKAMLASTGAVRIYIAAMNETVPHFHCHLVPRFEQMPEGASGFDAFGLLGRPYADGAYSADLAARINADLRTTLKSDPPPRVQQPAASGV